jgi:cardiolipin synthase
MTASPDESSDKSAVRFRRTLEGVIGVPATEGNRIDVLRNGDEIFPAMLEAIEAAENTIDFLTFVYWEGSIGGEFAQRLAARASANVRVRVLLDAWGANSMEPALVDLMTEAGVKLHWFRPIHKLRPSTLNHRTHRKVLVVDEATAFTGGVGIADEWRGDARDETEWRDTHFRVRGPGVDGLRSAFLDNWVETDDELFEDGFDRFPLQPEAGSAVVQCVRGASETGSSDVATLFRTLLQLARERVRITTAYFVPDEELTRRICDARVRGVDVQILIPGPNADKRFVQIAGEASFEPLLDAGVEIFSYQTSMLHAKIMTIDGMVSSIGSANVNSRSTVCDEEVNLVTIDRDLTSLLDRHFDEDLEQSVNLSPERWERRPLAQRALEKATNPVRRVF